MERKKIIEDLIASIDVQTFENMVLLYFADIGIFAINSDMNISGNIKYYDMYNELTKKCELLIIVLEGEVPTEENLEAANPGYSEYFIYSKTEDNIMELLSWLYNAQDEIAPFLKNLKDKIDAMHEIFEKN